MAERQRVAPPVAALLGGGEMGALTRAYDWSVTSLGLPETWPQSLRTIVGLLLASKAPMWMAWGPDRIFFYNDAYTEMLGAKHPALGKRLADVWAEIWTDVGRRVDAALAGEASRHEDLPLVIDRGGGAELAWFSFSYTPVRDDDGTIAGLFCAVAETTERVLVERRQAFRLALETRLRDIGVPLNAIAIASEALGRHLGVAQVAYAEVEPGGETVLVEREWNDGTMTDNVRRHRLDDYGPDLIADLRRGMTISIPNVRLDPRTSSPQAVAAFALTKVTGLLDVPIVKGGGLVAILGVHSETPRTWSNEEIALAEDIAERIWAAAERARAEIGLRESEARLRLSVAAAERRAAELHAVLESMPDAVYIGTTEGVVLANQPALDQLGFATPEELNRNVATLADEIQTRDADTGAFIPVEDQAFTRAFRGERIVQDVRVRHRKSGEEHVVRCAAAPVVVDGRVIAAVAVNTDVTDKRHAEERLRELNDTLEQRVAQRTAELERAHDQLRQSQKLESMGQLTGGVAHDFNNLLTPIIGSLDLLQRRGLGGDRERRLIEGALQSAERAKTLVQRLLAFARRQPLQSHAIDVSALVQGMAALIASTSGPRIKLELDVADDLSPAWADANQLEMALLNLAVNARDAMPDGGTLTIAARPAVAGQGQRSLKPGHYVRLSVSDTGTGMDEATLARAVEPFFSTKGIGRGTGLGLSMVHGLAAQLGGELSISSRPRLGTCVELWLPVSDAAAPRPEPAGSTETPMAVGTVLLVDDDELVRVSTADMLADLGYAVTEAASAGEALQFMDTGHRFDLLITDHLMPGMTGTELAREVRNRRPGTPVLIVSGYADVDGVAPDLPRLVKPFRQADLAAKLGELDTGSSG